MESQRNPDQNVAPEEDQRDFDFDWEALTFSSDRVPSDDSPSIEDWEDRFNEDTTGYVSNPLTTSFTDLDLGPAQLELRKSAEWAELDSWLDA